MIQSVVKFDGFISNRVRKQLAESLKGFWFVPLELLGKKSSTQSEHQQHWSISA